MLGKDPRKEPSRSEPQPRVPDMPLSLTFSELRYFFQCPYEFKLRFLYGFDSPVNRALGFGKSLHDALCEIHAESIRGSVPTVADVPQLVERHLHLPFANEQVRENSVRGAEKALRQYLNKHGEHLTRLEHAEKTVELKLADGVVVSGRIESNSPNRYQRNCNRRFQIRARTRNRGRLCACSFRFTRRAIRRRPAKTPTGSRSMIWRWAISIGGEVQESVIATLERVVRRGKQIRDVDLPKDDAWCNACDACDSASAICLKKPVPARHGGAALTLKLGSPIRPWT